MFTLFLSLPPSSLPHSSSFPRLSLPPFFPLFLLPWLPPSLPHSLSPSFCPSVRPSFPPAFPPSFLFPSTTPPPSLACLPACQQAFFLYYERPLITWGTILISSMSFQKSLQAVPTLDTIPASDVKNGEENSVFFLSKSLGRYAT